MARAHVRRVHVSSLICSDWKPFPRAAAAYGTGFTSMPVGANTFVFAARYDRAIGSVSATVAVSTAIAVISVTAILAVLQMIGLAAMP